MARSSSDSSAHRVSRLGVCPMIQEEARGVVEAARTRIMKRGRPKLEQRATGQAKKEAPDCQYGWNSITLVYTGMERP